MEEYGSTPVVQTGTTTNVTGNITFAGNLEQLELADWSGGVYFPSSALQGGEKALTTTTDVVLCPFLCDATLIYKPAAALSAAALSERSQLNSGSSRPKWP